MNRDIQNLVLVVDASIDLLEGTDRAEHIHDIVNELLEVAPHVSADVAIQIAGDNPDGAIEIVRDSLRTLGEMRPNALHPVDEALARVIMRRFLRDQASADRSVDFGTVTERRRAARGAADEMAVRLADFETAAAVLEARERAAANAAAARREEADRQTRQARQREYMTRRPSVKIGV